MDHCLRVAILIGLGFPFQDIPSLKRFIVFERDRFTRPPGDLLVIDSAITMLNNEPVCPPPPPVPLIKRGPGRPRKVVQAVEILSVKR